MRFDIGTVLSISHDHLLCPIDNVYKILNFMLDENLYTHQLPRAGRFARPFVFQQHPQLAEWDLYDPQVNRDTWEDLLIKARDIFGTHLEIKKVPPGVWTQKNPLEEAEEMVGKDRVIAIEVDKSIEPNKN